MIHSIGNEYLSITVSENGAELQSIRDNDGTEYLWQGDPKYWADRALNIFPYVARLTNGQYELDGKQYAMRIHGIALYERFELTEKSQSMLVFTLRDSQETYLNFPRHFLFQVVYEINCTTLNISYRVKNLDKKTLYFAVGGHPGFNVPLNSSETFEDYCLVFSNKCKPKRIGFTEACFLDETDSDFALIKDRILPLSHDLFDQDAIVLKEMDKEVTLKAEDGLSITVRYPDFPYLGIWHAPKTDAPYVCIEPWSSLPSTQDKIAVFEDQKDMLSLEPGKTYINTWQIIVGKDKDYETL